jgi:hypothetical protein
MRKISSLVIAALLLSACGRAQIPASQSPISSGLALSSPLQAAAPQPVIATCAPRDDAAFDALIREIGAKNMTMDIVNEKGEIVKVPSSDLEIMAKQEGTTLMQAAAYQGMGEHMGTIARVLDTRPIGEDETSPAQLLSHDNGFGGLSIERVPEFWISVYLRVPNSGLNDVPALCAKLQPSLPSALLQRVRFIAVPYSLRELIALQMFLVFEGRSLTPPVLSASADQRANKVDIGVENPATFDLGALAVTVNARLGDRARYGTDVLRTLQAPETQILGWPASVGVPAPTPTRVPQPRDAAIACAPADIAAFDAFADTLLLTPVPTLPADMLPYFHLGTAHPSNLHITAALLPEITTIKRTFEPPALDITNADPAAFTRDDTGWSGVYLDVSTEHWIDIGMRADALAAQPVPARCEQLRTQVRPEALQRIRFFPVNYSLRELQLLKRELEARLPKGDVFIVIEIDHNRIRNLSGSQIDVPALLTEINRTLGSERFGVDAILFQIM